MEQEPLRAPRPQPLSAHTAVPTACASVTGCLSHTQRGGCIVLWASKEWSCPPRLTHPTAALAQATVVPTMCMAAAAAALLVHSTDSPQLLKTRAMPKGRMQLAHPTGPNIRCQPHLVLRHGSHSSTKPLSRKPWMPGTPATLACAGEGPRCKVQPSCTSGSSHRWWAACLTPLGQPCW